MKGQTLAALELSYPAGFAQSDHVPCKVSKRLLAFALDTVALSICIFAGAILCWRLVGAAISFDLLQPGPDNGLLADGSHIRLTTYVSAVISLCYFIGSWLTLSASPGQRLVGIRLYSARTGKPLKVSQALGRWVLLGGPLWIVATATPDELGVLLTLATLVWSGFLLVSTVRSHTGQAAHDRWTGSVLTLAPQAANSTPQLRLVNPDVR